MRQCAGEGRPRRGLGGPLRAIVIVNPTAGGGRTRGKWPGIRDQLYVRNIEAQFRFTTGPGDATLLAKEAVESGFDTLIAVGGDGTINEVANGARFAVNPVRLGIIPTGTGRDIARSLGIRGVDHAIDLLGLDRERKIDAGVTSWTEDGKRHSRYFLLYCGSGFVTDVNRSMTSGWKRLGNTIPYASGTIRQLRRPPGREMTWSIDGVEESGRQTAIVVFNQQYFGGGMKAAPGALADDGLLDVMAVGDVSRLQALTILATIYSGRHVNRRGVWHKPARSVRIDGPDLWFDLDGEVIGRTPVEVNVAPGAITLAQ